MSNTTMTMVKTTVNPTDPRSYGRTPGAVVAAFRGQVCPDGGAVNAVRMSVVVRERLLTGAVTGHIKGAFPGSVAWRPPNC